MDPVGNILNNNKHSSCVICGENDPIVIVDNMCLCCYQQTGDNSLTKVQKIIDKRKGRK